MLDHLPDHASEDDIDRVLLCVSELVSNAVEHGGPPRLLDLVVTGREVRVEVHDGDPHQPKPLSVSSLCAAGAACRSNARTPPTRGVAPEGAGKLKSGSRSPRPLTLNSTPVG